MSQNDFDVIVIGGGGAGMSAALMAAESGSRVLLVEAGARCGGATALSSGAFYAAATRVQREAGITGDTAQAMYIYAMALNRYRMEPSLLRRFCEESGEALHWLLDLGVKVLRLSQSDVSDVARSHWIAGGGAGIAEALEAHLQSAGVEVATHTRVQKLLIEDTVVAGIEVEGEVIRAKAVVVATGGFGANESFLARYYPASDIEGRWYVGPATSQGDAILLGDAAGADLYGHDRGLRMMSPGLNHTVEVPPAWLVFVNRLGRRFMDEGAPYCVHHSAMQGQPDQTAYAIFDQAALDAPPTDFRFAPLIAAGMLTTDWRHDILELGVRDGKILKGDTLADLAVEAGVAAEALVETVARYNADAEAGTDTLFFKNAGHLRSLGPGPYYAATLKMQILGMTSCGLRIDRETRVLDVAGKRIAGLYAAGEASGGVMGEVYIGSGNAIANAVTFGRIAGRAAGAHAKSNSAHSKAFAEAYG